MSKVLSPVRPNRASPDGSWPCSTNWKLLVVRLMACWRVVGFGGMKGSRRDSRVEHMAARGAEK